MYPDKSREVFETLTVSLQVPLALSFETKLFSPNSWSYNVVMVLIIGINLKGHDSYMPTRPRWLRWIWIVLMIHSSGVKH